MACTWTPLIEAALCNYARNDHAVTPYSGVVITSGPEIACFVDGPSIDTPTYHITAILHDTLSQTCDERSFLLPSAFPKESLDSYSIYFDEVTGIIHVASRRRYVSVREYLELKDSTLSSNSTPYVEFSGGKVTGITRNQKSNISSHKTKKPQGLMLNTDISSPLIDENAKGDRSTQPTPESLVTMTFSPTVITPTTGETTPVTSGGFGSPQSSSEPATPMSPSVTEITLGADQYYEKDQSAPSSKDDLSTLLTPKAHFRSSLHGLVVEDQISKPPTIQIDLSTVQYRTPRLPSAHGVLRIDDDGAIHEVCAANVSDKTSLNDSAMPEQNCLENIAAGTATVTVAHHGESPVSEVTDGHMIPASNALPRISRHSIQNLPSFFSDRNNLSENTIALDILTQAYDGKPETPEAPLFSLDLAPPYKGKKRVMAGDQKDAPSASTESDIFEEHKSPNRTSEPFAPTQADYDSLNLDAVFGDDEDYLDPQVKAPVVNLPSFAPSTGDANTEALHASNSLGLQAIDRDFQPREDHHAEVDVFEDEGRRLEENPFHHINFLGFEVYERCYTPPEVSFWAASTCYDKGILKKEKLPAVHHARVIASQAFRWVDPTKYIGKNIYELWQKEGTALRDAATSDVKVVYQEIGTWLDDEYTADEIAPMIAPSNNNNEFASNGNYNVFQLPYLFDIQDPNNKMPVVYGPPAKYPRYNTTANSKHGPSRLRYDISEKLEKEWAKELAEQERAKELAEGRATKRAKEAALRTKKLEEKYLRKRLACIMEVIIKVEEHSDVKETDHVSKAEPSIGQEVNGAPSEAEPSLMQETNEVDSEAEYSIVVETNEVDSAAEPSIVTEIDDAISEAETDIQDENNLDRSPTHFQDSDVTSAGVGKQTTTERETVEQEVTPNEETSQPESSGGETIDQTAAPRPTTYWTTAMQTSFPISQDTLDTMAKAKYLEEVVKPRMCAEMCARNRVLYGSPLSSDDEDPESDKESFDGDNGITDHSCKVRGLVDPASHEHAAHLARFSEDESGAFDDLGDNVEASSSEVWDLKTPRVADVGQQYTKAVDDSNEAMHSLEDGRHFSPSKMISSWVGEPRTPVHSPSKDSDFGVWETDGDGSYMTPRMPIPDTRSPAYNFAKLGPAESIASTHWRSLETQKLDDDVFAPTSSRLAVQTEVGHVRRIQSRLPLPVPSSRLPSTQGKRHSLQSPRSRFKPSISPVAEVPSNLELSTSRNASKEVMLLAGRKTLRSSGLRMPLSGRHTLGLRMSPTTNKFADLMSRNRVTSGIAEKQVLHSRKDSSDDSSRYTSTDVSRSTSMSEPLSDSEISQLQDLASRIDVKGKGVEKSTDKTLLTSSSQKRAAHLSKALTLLRDQTSSTRGDDLNWERFQHAGDEQNLPNQPLDVAADKNPKSEEEGRGIGPMMAEKPTSQLATTPALHVSHSTVAEPSPPNTSQPNPPPQIKQPQQPHYEAAGDIVERENNDDNYDDDDANLALILFGPFAVVSLVWAGWTAWKVKKWMA